MREGKGEEERKVRKRAEIEEGRNHEGQKRGNENNRQRERWRGREGPGMTDGDKEKLSVYKN